LDMENLSGATSIEQAYTEPGSEQIIGNSPALETALVELERVAPTKATAVASRVTGSGKELPIVFVVDHDASIRESLEFLIRCKGWQPETFAFAREFLDRPRSLVPNCLVLDLSPQGLNGLDLQKRIAIERTETPIIFITAHGDVPTSVQAMKAGAVEFLMKPFSNEALLNAIREGLKRSSVSLGRESEMRSLRDCYASLSRRERQVMVLVVSGLSNKQAGAELGISEITVKAHRGQVMQKMKAESFADLVRMATRLRAERTLSASVSVQVTAAFSSGSVRCATRGRLANGAEWH
jgi:FixJ family two-component response regulator